MIKYYFDGEPHYMIGNKSYTESELQAMRAETAAKDEKAGYNDRIVGVYDKWYRYNCADNGAVYDRGQRKAVCATPKSAAVFVIIECAH